MPLPAARSPIPKRQVRLWDLEIHELIFRVSMIEINLSDELIDLIGELILAARLSFTLIGIVTNAGCVRTNGSKTARV